MTALPRKPICARSGSLLPQHLQLRDAYLEDLVAAQLESLAPHAWGFADLTVDGDALASSRVRLLTLQARFPSGALAFLTASEPPLERALPGNLEEGASLRVWLALENAWRDAPNASPSTASTRFLATSAADGRPVLQPRLQILFDGDDSTAEDRMLLGRVLVSNRAPSFDSSTLPPMLRVLEESSLARGVRAVVASLLSRQAELVTQRSDRPFEPRTFDPAHAPKLFLLSAVNQALSVLEDERALRELAPSTVHATLADLLGALEALDGRVPPPIAPYLHDDPGACFGEVVTRLLAVIPAVARVAHLAYPLERTDAVTFSLRIAEPSRLRRRVYLVASGVNSGRLEAELPMLAKIASDTALPSIVHSAVRGTALAPEFDPPESLPSNANSACFRVDTRSEYWADILERRQMLVHLPSAPASLTLTLYVLPSER